LLALAVVSGGPVLCPIGVAVAQGASTSASVVIEAERRDGSMFQLFEALSQHGLAQAVFGMRQLEIELWQLAGMLCS